MSQRRFGPAAFTLIELMIVVAVIAVLASIAIPKFALMIRRSQEGGAKGNLGSLRSALTIYYGDNAGWYPVGGWNSNSTVLSDSLIPKYLDRIPTLTLSGYHDTATNNVFSHWQIAYGDTHDGTGWIYDGYWPSDANWGTIWVACTHTDTKTQFWSSY